VKSRGLYYFLTRLVRTVYLFTKEVPHVSFDNYPSSCRSVTNDEYNPGNGFGCERRAFIGLVAIQPELLYVQKGAKCDVDPFTGTDIGETYTVKLDYLQLPVLAAMSVPLPSLVKPRIFAGPYVAYNLKAQGSYANASPTDLDFIKAFDYGAVVGIGTDLDFLIAKVMLDGRYTFGLASIHEDGDDVKNRTISVMVGLLLNF